MGMSDWVYPGATHTRFHHALGALNITLKAMESLRRKGIEITDEEYEGTALAILLHDIGHGPYSHTLEHTLIQGVHHEDISTKIMHRLNLEFKGALTLAMVRFLEMVCPSRAPKVLERNSASLMLISDWVTVTLVLKLKRFNAECTISKF